MFLFVLPFFFKLLVLVLCSPTGTNFTDNELVPVQSIPGTDLLTGVFYRINLKSSGLLTWSWNKNKDESYHVQIVYGSVADSYANGKENAVHAEWMFIPSEETVKGNYLLVNRGILDAVFTYQSDSPSGKYSILHQDQAENPKYLPNGEWRRDAMFFIRRDELYSNYYSIHNAALFDSILTWVSKDVEAGRKYCQFQKGSKPTDWLKRNDYIWSFTPALRATATLTKFSTEKTPADVLKSLTKKVDLMHESIISNDADLTEKRTFKETREVGSTFTFGFAQSLRIISKLSVEAQPVPLFSKVSAEISTEIGLDAHQEKSVTEKRTFEITKEIEVKPFTCAKVVWYYESIQGLDQPFTALMKIKGSADRMTFGRKVRANQGINSGQSVKALMESERFEGTFDHVDDSAAYYEVTGNIKADYATKDYFQSNKIDCIKG